MKIFIGSLTGLVIGSNHTKCVLLSNQKGMMQSTLINLHPNGYRQEFHYYPFLVKLGRCAGSCTTITDLSNKHVFQIKQRFKSKHFQHDYRYKWTENINKAYFMQI